MLKEIILYYSRSGNTEKLAFRIRDSLQCQALKIEPEDAYGNYISSCLRVMKERAKKVPPKFVTPIPDLSSFHIILLGYPVWAQDVPVFVSDFISQCDLKGKLIIPFATFGGTGISWTMKTLRQICPESEIKLPFNYGLIKKDDFNQWIKSVNDSTLAND